MIRVFSSLLLISLLSGCGIISTKPITPEKFTELKGKKLAVTKPIDKSVAVVTIGGALIEGMTIFNANEDDLKTTFSIQDPAVSISNNVKTKLAKKSKIKIVKEKQLKELSRDAEEVLAQFPEADYVLDINTVSSIFSYRPLEFGVYKLTYNAKLQLFEAKSKTVVAEAICHQVTDDETSFGYDEYLKDNAKLLKGEFNRAAKLCSEEFSKKILTI